MNEKKANLPRIGMRMIKSAIGVFLCFVIYLVRGKHGTPFYSALAVLWCIQSHTKDTVRNALQRAFGTLIGAIYGLIFILFKMYVVDLGNGILHYLIIAGLIIPIIYTTLLFRKKNASYFSCVVYLSIVVNHLGDADPLRFVLDRSMDTLIGIVLGLVINLFHFHGRVQTDVLFVADMDNALRNTEEKLTPYSRFSLSSLLEDGMHLTIMTLRTPATYLEAMSDIRPKHPIIAMDGAILYDINENSYPKVYVISADRANEIEEYIRCRGFRLFSTVILEDVLLIYYDKLENDAEKKIYDTLHRSPYRNYLNKPRPGNHSVVYFMVVDRTKKVKMLLEEMDTAGVTEQFKILSYPSDDYPGFSYLKIYNKNASVENMIDYLKELSGIKKIVTVSDDHSRHDVMYAHHDSNEIVRRLNSLYYWGRGI